MYMERRALGTDLMISSVGLGAEHWKGLPYVKVAEIIFSAAARGIDFIDLVWGLPEILKGVSVAQKLVDLKLQVHLGSLTEGDKYVRSRDPARCREGFDNVLEKLGRSHIEVANIHYASNFRVWEEIKKRRVLSLANELKQEGRAKAVGVSTHSVEVVNDAVNTGLVDVVTYQVNFANHGMPGRDEALRRCEEAGVGVIAMKPFAGGLILQAGKHVKIPGYKRGGKSSEFEVPLDVTPSKCLDYSLGQPGVSSVIAGFRSVDEVEWALCDSM